MTITATGALSPDTGTVPVFPFPMFDPVHIGVDENGEHVRVNPRRTQHAARRRTPRRQSCGAEPHHQYRVRGSTAPRHWQSVLRHPR